MRALGPDSSSAGAASRPSLLLAAAVPLLVRSRGPASPAWLYLGLLLCVAGQALRAWVLGEVPDGTSGQNEKLIATSLNTAGPYALTRNPLYLGNLCITLGLCAAAHDPWLVLLAAALFWLQYRAIIAAEEDFLRSRSARNSTHTARGCRASGRRSAARVRPAPGISAARCARSTTRPPRGLRWPSCWSPRTICDEPARPYAIALGRRRRCVWLCVKGWKHHWLHGGFRKDLKRRLRETAR